MDMVRHSSVHRETLQRRAVIGSEFRSVLPVCTLTYTTIKSRACTILYKNVLFGSVNILPEILDVEHVKNNAAASYILIQIFYDFI